MQKIDQRLPALVALEFASELQSGTQITALVQRIAKRADALLQIQKIPASHSMINSIDDNNNDDGNNDHKNMTTA